MAPALLDLPHEVLHSIFTLIDPADLAALTCCRTLAKFLQTDKLLYKELYLNNFDDPPSRAGDRDWEVWLKSIVKASKLLNAHDDGVLKSGLQEIMSVVEHLIQTAGKEGEDTGCGIEGHHSANLSWLRKHLDNEHQQQATLATSNLYQWAASHAWQQQGQSNTPLPRILPSDTYTAEDQSFAVPSNSHRHPPTKPSPPSNLQTPFPSQLSAHLHVLYGVPIQTLYRSSSRLEPTPRYPLRSASTLPIHTYARSRVYDLRQHTDATLWGPFRDEIGRKVDWEKMEAIMLILDHNYRNLSCVREVGEGVLPDWTRGFAGASPYSYVSREVGIPLEPALPLEALDPYNVTGTWMRIVCFLDYTELFDFNFSGLDADLPTPPDNASAVRAAREPLDTDEAIRLITMKISVTKIEEARADEGEGTGLPKVWFKGTSASVRPSWDPNANSRIRGCVRLTPEGQVHWTSWSIFYGEERWRSEGVQVGGVQSARGVLGFWFDKDYDEHGPAGPTAFWKSHDGVEKKDERGLAAQDLHALHMPMY